MSTVFFIRHGHCKSIDLEDHDCVLGDNENNLTEIGVNQALQLGSYFSKHYPEHIIYSSPILRASETSLQIANITGNSVILDDRLRERDFRFPNDLTIAKAKEYQVLSHLNPLQSYLGGETVQQHRSRVEQWLADFESKLQQDAAYLIVTHGGTIDQLQAILFGSPIDTPRRFYTVCEPAHFHSWSILDVESQTSVWRLDNINSFVD